LIEQRRKRCGKNTIEEVEVMKGRWVKIVGFTFLLMGLTLNAKAMGPGMGGGSMGRPCSPMMGMAAPGGQLPFDHAKMQKFYQDTQQLRAKIWQIKDELRMLYLQATPDWKAISQKRSELIGLVTELQKKAFEMGIPFSPMRGMGKGCGCGMMF